MAINNEPHIHQLVMCANIFIRKDDKYLVLHRSPQKTFAPDVIHPVGGKIDPNEDPFTTAEREVLEEAGVQVKNMRLEAVINELLPPPRRDYNWLIFHFTADYAGGDVVTTEEGELVWMTADEIKASRLFPSVRPLIDKILNPNAGTVFATFAYNEHDDIDGGSAVISECAH
ncbi:MAG TPA: NUDIX domain-containing protein [Candidatus Saccharimonadia bacterium]|jgi:8-oxo-dGTP diphosphatase